MPGMGRSCPPYLGTWFKDGLIDYCFIDVGLHCPGPIHGLLVNFMPLRGFRMLLHSGSLACERLYSVIQLA